MKSALELAMERADASLGDESIELTAEQKTAIDAIRKTYQAKWAEREIALQGKLTDFLRDAEPGQVAEAQSQIRREMARVREELDEERDTKIAAVRAGK